MKVVIDTNILWVSISRKSKTHWVYENLLKGNFILCVTTDILEEYEEIVGQKMGEEVAESFMQTLIYLPNIEFITRYYEWNLLYDIDPDDDKFVDCAVAASSDYLATNDRHFNILHEIDFPKINLINLDEFKKILGVSDL